MKQVPNLLSAARLLATPYILYLLGTGRYRVALVWFAIAGITDVLDGFLARRFHSGSRLGAMLDPVADKVLLGGSFLTLAVKGDVPVWLTALVLGRDLLILAFAMAALARKTRRDFPPSVWGKASTLAQITYILFAVGFEAGLTPNSIAWTLGWVTAALAVWSGLDYARRSRAAGSSGS